MRLTTRARIDACPHCAAATIHALDAPVAAIDTRLDPQPLTVAAELAALLSGRRTYDLIPIAGRHEIAWRDQWRIPHRRYPILATHQCPGLIPANALPSRRPRKARTNEPPPF